MKLSISPRKLWVPLVIATVIAVNLTLGLLRLEPYSAVDEPYWTYQRTPKFWHAIAQMKWRSTNINDKPGITTAILSGAGLLKANPLDYKDLRDKPKTTDELNTINNINFFFRLPIFLFCLLSLPLFYIFLRKLLNETIALLAFVFIGLSPILLGISLIINPDSLLWIFLPLSMLSYLVFRENSEKKYLFLSGIFLGLSLLTKYVANILYVFFFMLPFLEYFLTAAESRPPIRIFLKRFARDYGVLVAISMLVFFALFPATWKHPEILLEGTFLSKAFKSTWPIFAGLIALVVADATLLKSRILSFVLDSISRYRNLIIRSVFSLFLLILCFVAMNTLSGMTFFSTDASLASPKGSGGDGTSLFIFADNIVADFYSLMFAISPLALLGIVSALLLGMTRKRIGSRETKTVFFLSLFILFYYIASTVNHVIATVRYQIALFPFAFVVSAIGIFFLVDSLPENIGKRWQASSSAILLALLVSLISLFSVKPFYFAYTSAFLPNPYFVNMKDMGDGSWETADFLNKLPNARELSIWSDKGAVCAVFVGKCQIGLSQKDLRDLRVDYVVVSSGRRSRTLKLSHPGSDPINFKKAYETNETAKTITIGNRSDNFIKIVPAAPLLQNTSSE